MDGSAFAVVSTPTGKHAGLYSISLVLFLTRGLIFDLKLLETAKINPRWPVFQRKPVEIWSFWGEKEFSNLTMFIFQMKPIMIPIYNQIKKNCVSWGTFKNVWNNCKNLASQKTLRYKIKEKSLVQNLKLQCVSLYQICVKIWNFCILKWMRKNPSKIVKTGPVRFTTDIYFLVRKKHFCTSYISNLSRFAS